MFKKGFKEHFSYKIEIFIKEHSYKIGIFHIEQRELLVKKGTGQKKEVESVSKISPFQSTQSIKDEIATVVLQHLAAKFDLTPKQLLEILAKESVSSLAHAKERAQASEAFPIILFAEQRLSGLELVVKYLKEERGKSVTEIGLLLGRSPKTIWTTYAVSQKKVSNRTDLQKILQDKQLLSFLRSAAPSRELEKIQVPFSVLANRRLSILESIAQFLHDSLHLSFKQIAVVLHRDNRTIWTVYHRAQKKLSTQHTAPKQEGKDDS